MNSETPSSSRVGLPGGRGGRAPGEDPCCRWDSGTGRGRGGLWPRAGVDCAVSSTSWRRCCTQTADVVSTATSTTTDAARTTMSSANHEVMLAVEQSVQNNNNNDTNKTFVERRSIRGASRAGKLGICSVEQVSF